MVTPYDMRFFIANVEDVTVVVRLRAVSKEVKELCDQRLTTVTRPKYNYQSGRTVVDTRITLLDDMVAYGKIGELRYIGVYEGADMHVVLEMMKCEINMTADGVEELVESGRVGRDWKLLGLFEAYIEWLFLHKDKYKETKLDPRQDGYIEPYTVLGQPDYEVGMYMAMLVRTVESCFLMSNAGKIDRSVFMEAMSISLHLAKFIETNEFRDDFRFDAYSSSLLPWPCDATRQFWDAYVLPKWTDPFYIIEVKDVGEDCFDPAIEAAEADDVALIKAFYDANPRRFMECDVVENRFLHELLGPRCDEFVKVKYAEHHVTCTTIEYKPNRL